MTARIVLRAMLVFVAAAVVATPAHGQHRQKGSRRGAVVHSGAEIGIHAGYNFDIDQILVGVQASFPLTRGLELYPSFDYFTPQTSVDWSLNFDLKVRPPARYQFWYGGAGLNLRHAATTTSHLNLFAGFAGRPGPFRPYAEARLTVANGSAFQVVGGLSFPIR